MRNIVLTVFAIIGASFTLFSLLIWLGPRLRQRGLLPMSREERWEWEYLKRLQENPAMKEKMDDRDGYAKYCFLMIWFYTAFGVVSYLGVVAFEAIFK